MINWLKHRLLRLLVILTYRDRYAKRLIRQTEEVLAEARKVGNTNTWRVERNLRLAKTYGIKGFPPMKGKRIF